MPLDSVQNKSILTPTGGFLKQGFTHSLNPYLGCSFAGYSLYKVQQRPSTDVVWHKNGKNAAFWRRVPKDNKPRHLFNKRYVKFATEKPERVLDFE